MVGLIVQFKLHEICKRRKTMRVLSRQSKSMSGVLEGNFVITQIQLALKGLKHRSKHSKNIGQFDASKID